MKTMNKDLKKQLTEMHLEDYDMGAGWGAATSHPYRVKKWLSKSLSDRLLADAYAEYDRAKAVFDSIPVSKRVVRNASMLCPELRRWEEIGCQAALPTKVEGHAVCLSCVEQACYKNSCRRYKAELLARDAEAFCFVVNGNDSGYPSYNRLMKWMIYWDAGKQRFYRLEWKRASTGPVPESARRRKWARGAKRKEFLAECKKLQENLVENGIEIRSLVKDGGRWRDEVYVDCYDPSEIQDPAGEFAAAEGGLAVQPVPAPGPAAVEVTVDVECKETGMTWSGVKIGVDPAAVRPDCDELVAYVRRSPEIGGLCRQYLIGADDVSFVVHNIDDAVAALARN